MKADVAQLVSVAIYSPVPDETVRFFHDLLGMEISHREGRSVYLRAYEDFYQYSLKITEATPPGLEEITWRAASHDALQRCVKAIEASGCGAGWREGDYAHGPAYAFKSPDGHRMKILWELDYFKAPDDLRSKLPNRLFSTTVPTLRLREQKIGEGGVEVGAWLSVSAMVHEIAIMRDATGSRGRLHHLAYWYGAHQPLLDIADIFSERDVRIEAGPGKHGVTQGYFLYCFEPGGNRVELFGDTGYLIFDPDWQSVVWNVANEVDLEKSSIWFGSQLPKTFYRYGTPIVPGASLEEIRSS